MAKNLDQMMQKLPPGRQAKVEARMAALVAEEMTLRDLREAHHLTQQKLAEILNVKQESISNLERRSDILLSTFQSYVQAMGGSLQLVASFPGRPPVSLRTFGDIPKPKPKPRKRHGVIDAA